MTPAPAPSLAFALALVLALCACQALNTRLEEEIFTDTLQLTMDRPADLIPPEGLRVAAVEDREVDLAWDPVLLGDVAGYAVLRATDLAGSFELIGFTTSRFGTVYNDRGNGEEQLGDGQDYFYRVHPYDRAGRISKSHAYIAATTETRPDPPIGLRTYSNLPRKVVLVWDPTERRSTTGYTVLRSPTVAGPWERIGYAEGRLNTVYEDGVPGDLRVMYYRILATNRFGGESDPADPVRAVTKAEPLPPIGLQVAARQLGLVEIAWEPNVETDLTRYEVWRASGNGDGQAWGGEQRVGQVEPERTSFEDTRVGCAQPVRYRIRAVDRDGLYSEYSGSLETVGEDMGLSIEEGPGLARALLWDPERAGSRTPARVLVVRGVGPDRELGTVTGATRMPLEELGTGRHRLALELPPPALEEGAEPGRLGSTRCEISVEIP